MRELLSFLGIIGAIAPGIGLLGLRLLAESGRAA